MIFNAHYYLSSSSFIPITIILSQKQIILNAVTPNKFQKKINYENCFGITYSKDNLRFNNIIKNVADYIPFLLQAPSQNDVDNNNEDDVNKTYTTLTIHSLDIPEKNRMSSNNDYLEYTISFKTFKETNTFYNILKEKLKIKENRHILCILNPMSGNKNSLKVYNELILPMFKIANITSELKQTKYQFHCEEIVNSLNLNDYDGICSVSGDGLFHELLNGLLSRNDWEKARYFPIGLINSGTSNALNINFDITTSRHSILNIIKGNEMLFDIIRASQGDKVYYGHLSLSWGVMADTDIQSDRYRIIGKYKYYLAGMFRIIFVNRYHGNLYYLPEDSKIEPAYDIINDFETNKSEREKIRLKRISMKELRVNNEMKTINSEETISGNEEIINNESKMKSNETLNNIDFESMKNVPSDKYNKDHVGLGPKARYTNDYQVTEDNLKNWEHVEMNFTSFSACNYPFLASDMLFAPDANPQDGMIDMIYTDTLKVYNIMLDDAHGTYYKGKKNYHVKRTKAFILIPDNTKTGEGGEFGVGLVDSKGNKDLDHGIFDLDGEIMPYEPVRFEILPQFQNIFAPAGMNMNCMGKTIRKPI